MSWFSDNYEKAAIGGSLVIALALGYGIYRNMDAVENAFKRDSVRRNDDVSVPGLSKILAVKESLQTKWEIPDKDVDGRKVHLMTGVHLYAKRGALDEPVDLLKSPPVHQGIPNVWWLENHVDPGYSDSPERDPDEDGFTNREEFNAKTKPKKFDSHPDPVVKLAVDSVYTTQYHLKATDYGEGKYKVRLQNSRGKVRNRMGTAPVKAGDVVVFTGPLMKKRFRFKGTEKMKIKKKSGSVVEETILVYEDLQSNKLGKIYRFDRRGNRVGENVPKGIIDSVVEFHLNALGENGNVFKVRENERFSLPYKKDANEKPYLLKKVNIDNKTVEIEYRDADGNTQIHEISYAK